MRDDGVILDWCERSPAKGVAGYGVKCRACFLCALMLVLISCLAAEEQVYGPIYSDYPLTLGPGERQEIIGPLFYSQQLESTHTWAIPPLTSYTRDRVTEYTEWDLAYPVITYDRFGAEYRFQVFQLLAFSGGKTYSETNVHRFTLFPLIFVQRSKIPERNYTAFIPFYGDLQNRLFRDEIHFVMWPFYVKTRKGEVITENYPAPFIHNRYGPGLKGWQFWPFYGEEHKVVTWRTNMWGEGEQIGGHEKMFALWPIYSDTKTGIGTTNPATQLAIIPLYTRLRSPNRDSTSYLWPFGYTHTIDREKKYEEWDAPWPLIVFARGEGKTTDRVFPFFSQSHSPTLEDNWYMWPVYKYSRINAPPLDRSRTRILFYLYSDIVEKNTETGQAARRVDLWPFFWSRRNLDGDRYLQVLAPLEPFLPNSKSIERNYSPIWALWRQSKNAKTGVQSQSLLWNLYRREAGPEEKRISLLLGLFQYEATKKNKRVKLFYIPVAKTGAKDKPAGKNP